MQIVTNVTNVNRTPTLTKFCLCDVRLLGATCRWHSTQERKSVFHVELKIAVTVFKCYKVASNAEH